MRFQGAPTAGTTATAAGSGSGSNSGSGGYAIAHQPSSRFQFPGAAPSGDAALTTAFATPFPFPSPSLAPSPSPLIPPSSAGSVVLDRLAERRRVREEQRRRLQAENVDETVMLNVIRAEARLKEERSLQLLRNQREELLATTLDGTEALVDAAMEGHEASSGGGAQSAHWLDGESAAGPPLDSAARQLPAALMSPLVTTAGPAFAFPEPTPRQPVSARSSSEDWYLSQATTPSVTSPLSGRKPNGPGLPAGASDTFVRALGPPSPFAPFMKSKPLKPMTQLTPRHTRTPRAGGGGSGGAWNSAGEWTPRVEEEEAAAVSDRVDGDAADDMADMAITASPLVTERSVASSRTQYGIRTAKSLGLLLSEVKAQVGCVSHNVIV
jgi:hypothetical protein